MKHVRQNIVERFRVAGHFERDVKAFFHSELFHRVRQFLRLHVEGEIDLHFPGELEPVRIHIGDDDVTRAGMFANRDGHATDRPRAGDEHIFADKIERQRGVNGVAHRIETGQDIERN
jgi:hypothetical protein